MGIDREGQGVIWARVADQHCPSNQRGPQSGRKQIRVRHFSMALVRMKGPSSTHLSDIFYTATTLCDKWFSDVWTG